MASKDNSTLTVSQIRAYHDVSAGFWKSLTRLQKNELRMEANKGIADEVATRPAP